MTIDHHAGPVRRQAGQDSDGISGLVRQQHTDRLAGRNGRLDHVSEASRGCPDLCVGQVPGKVLAGNVISELLRGGSKQLDGRSIDPVLGKRAERNGRAVEVECRGAGIRPGDF